jgi:hypothetical protein
MPSAARGSQGEDLVLLWTCDGSALASCPPWRLCIWNPVPVEVRLEVLREPLGSCCRGHAEGPWVLEDLSRHARICGDLSEGWAEDMLSLRPQLSKSLAEE